MDYKVNNNTFKNGKSSKKKNPVVPLILIVIIAIVMVALQWFLIDFTSSMYNDNSETTVETTVQQNN